MRNLWNWNVQNLKHEKILIPKTLKHSVNSPDFIYHASRNPYHLKLKDLGDRVWCDQDTELNQGKWRSILKNKTELHVEIGCNAGHVIVDLAALSPSKAFIGIDWKHKSIYRAAQKSKEKNLSNLTFLRAHAERLHFIFAEEEIDHLFLFFPDPWPRKSQHKHRFISKERLKTISKLIKPGGTFQIKTDHAEYFEWINDAIQQTIEDWEMIEHSTHLHRNCPDPLKLEIPEVTLFEKIFIKNQIPIKSVTLKRKPA